MVSSIFQDLGIDAPEVAAPSTAKKARGSSKKSPTISLRSDPESDQFDPLLFLPDIRPIRSAERAPIDPARLRPELFTKEHLSTIPGMEWISYCEFVLLSPRFQSEEDQLSELMALADSLIDIAPRFMHEHMPANLPQGFNEPIIALDTETTGLDTRTIYGFDGKIIPQAKLCGISICASENKGLYLPTRHTQSDGFLNWLEKPIIQFTTYLLSKCVVINHNAQYDKEVLSQHGAIVRGFPHFLDTQTLDYLYDVNNKAHGLKPLSQSRLNRKMVEIQELFGGDKNSTVTFDRLPASIANVYAGSDAINTMSLFLFFLKDKNFPAKIQPVPTAIDHQTIDTLRANYRHGIPTNPRFNYYAALDCIYRVRLVRDTINTFCQEEVELNSPKEIARILYDVFNIPPLEGQQKGKSGSYSTDEDTLDALLEQNPDMTILRLIVLYRKLNNSLVKFHAKSLTNFFTDALFPYARMGISFSLTNVPTGRLSSASSKGLERVAVNRTDSGGVSLSYLSGAGDCGFNTQGVMTQPQVFVPTHKVVKYPKMLSDWFKDRGHTVSEDGLIDLYPKQIRNILIVEASKKSK